MEKRISDIRAIARDSIETKQRLLADERLMDTAHDLAEKVADVFRKDGKVFFCGNGGSAADAQHLAAEFSGRFYFDRDPLFSEALHVNTSYITAVANDYSYEEIYSRLVKAKVREGDILIGMSTSGNSANIVRAFEQARSQGGLCVGMTGESGGKMKAVSDILLNMPSSDTPRIQECHMLLGHAICQLVEEMLFERPA